MKNPETGLTGVLAVAALLFAMPAGAFEFDVAETPVKLENLFTVGGVWRMQDRATSLIGKSTVNPGICVSRVSPTLDTNPDKAASTNVFAGDTCTTSHLDSNERYVKARGSYSPNGDNGDLNFDRGDIVAATAKLTSDLSFSIDDFNVFARSIWFFDANYIDFEESHPDTTLQHAHSDFSNAGKRDLGTNFNFLEYNVARTFDIADHAVSVRVGNQVLNWGESSFLALNSLNTVNAPDQSRLRVPGFDIKELFQPQGMAVVRAALMKDFNVEAFYQYQWKPVTIDPVGSFFSTSDTLGPGGRYAMLSFAKAPEDPGVPTDEPNRYFAGREGLYAPRNNPDDPAHTLGSTAGRTIYRDLNEERRRRPDGTGQYGLALKTFLQDFNNGTELGFYYANYHSRFPVVSAFSAQSTCLPAPVNTGTPADAAANLAQAAVACQLTPRLDAPGAFNAGREALPVDTARLVVEYPKDIQMYGVSFNTTVGDFAWSGEYAFRPNLPVQIQTTDLIFAALNPAFPQDDYSLGIAVLPGRRSAVPDFVSQYRGKANGYGPNEYIRGYERLKVGQFGTTLLKTIGGDNPLGASQITVLAEVGFTNVFDMPGLDELQFQAAGGADTHASNGADGTRGISPRGTSAHNRTPDDGTACAETTAPVLPPNQVNPRCLRQNPTAVNTDPFGDDFSWGYRFVFLPHWDDAFFGVNFEWLMAMFHDVQGDAPGIGQNFVQGRKQILSGWRFDYLSKWSGEVRMTWYTGGGERDTSRDRDNLMVYAGYQF